MSNELNSIVDVQVTRKDTPISRVGFGTPMVLGVHQVFNERIRTYFDLDAMITDGFAVTAPEYLAAEKLFSQSPSVGQVDIGRRSLDKVEIEVVTAEDSTSYFATINDVVFPITSGVAATPATIALALVTAINLGAEPVTATDNADGTYDLVPDVSDAPFTLFVDERQEVQPYVPSDSITNDVVAIRAVDDDWYAITETLHDVPEVVELAGYIETTEKLFFTASDDVNIIDTTALTDTTSLAALIKDAGYDRTVVSYHESPTEFEAGFLGIGLPKDPGSLTWAFKTIIGITASKLNESQATNALDKNCNIYTQVAGVDITREGTVGGGEYIDIMRGIDWQTQRIREVIFSAFVNADKIPYTDGGIGIINSHLRAALSEGVTSGFLIDFITSAPKLAAVDPNDKAIRVLKNVTFKATPADAIQKVEIRGEVSIF